MQDTQLYEQLLGFVSPWFVCDVPLDIEEQAVRVYLDFDGRLAALGCPEGAQYANR